MFWLLGVGDSSAYLIIPLILIQVGFLLTRNSEPKTQSSSPAQFIAQNVEIVSVHGLHEVECSLALPNDDPVFNLQGKANLAIQRQGHVLLLSLQTQFNDSIV